MFGVGAFVAQRSGDVAPLVVGRARLLGAGWVREELTATRLHDAASSRYYWAPYDRVVDAERRAGLHVLGLLDYSNSWCLGDHGNVPHSAIRQVSREFAKYAYAVARHYRGRVSYWQVWNEPNLPIFWHPSTNPDDYARLLAAAYRAIKRANPHARVVMAGMSGVDLDFILRVAARTHSFDIVSVHPYRLVPEPKLLEQIQALRSLHKPIWFSEIGWAAGVGCDLCTSEQAQSAYLVRFYSLAAAADVQRVFWYDLRDDSHAPESPEAHFGLLRRDLSAKPAYAAYAVLARLLRHATFDRAVALGQGDVYALCFQVRGRSEAILWNTGSDPRPVSIPWESSAGTAFDMFGTPLGAVQIASGRAGFVLPPDGTPVFLVADDSIDRIGTPGALLHPPPIRVAAHDRAPSPPRRTVPRAAPRPRAALPARAGHGARRRRVYQAPRHPADSIHRVGTHHRRTRSEHGFRIRAFPTSTPLPTTVPRPAAPGVPPSPEIVETVATPSPSPTAYAATVAPNTTAVATPEMTPEATAAVTPEPAAIPTVLPQG